MTQHRLGSYGLIAGSAYLPLLICRSASHQNYFPDAFPLIFPQAYAGRVILRPVEPERGPTVVDHAAPALHSPPDPGLASGYSKSCRTPSYE